MHPFCSNLQQNARSFQTLSQGTAFFLFRLERRLHGRCIAWVSHGHQLCRHDCFSSWHIHVQADGRARLLPCELLASLGCSTITRLLWCLPMKVCFMLTLDECGSCYGILLMSGFMILSILLEAFDTCLFVNNAMITLSLLYLWFRQSRRN